MGKESMSLTPAFLKAALIAMALVLLAPAIAHSAEPLGEQLYKQNDCATCHAIDHTVVGPSYEAVAKKYAGQKGAVDMLDKAVKDGHVGTWGQVPMPPHPNLPDATIKTIVEWILTLK
ncbi:MAG: c-type cytochrome [Acetobacteraceae bacterium]